jgi:dipeptidase D
MANELPEALVGLEPKIVWEHFAQFAARPHGSGNEKEISDYMRQWAEAHSFACATDDTGNLVINVPGRGKGVGAKPVIIQGHVDMVCEKNSETVHDFEKDPLTLLQQDGWITADGTTLGADNAIGVCMGMAAAEGLFADHPPLELLMTIDEERGLTGARELDTRLLKGRRMLNLDAEEEGVLYVGCAGGQDTIASLDISRDSVGSDLMAATIALSGLAGGHSGLDIIKNRGNAIILMADLLHSLAAHGISYRLVDFEGGSMRNAIPRESKATILVDAKAREALPAILAKAEKSMLSLHADSETSVKLTVESVTNSRGPISQTQSDALLQLLYTAPNGVVAMSQTIAGMVETSTNLGVIKTTENSLRATFCSRSSNGEALELIARQLVSHAKHCGFEIQQEGGYPGWQPNLDSNLLKLAKPVLAQLAAGKELEVTAIHAGLECGLLGDKIAGIDMLSFGPDIRGAHSPDERVSISSVGVVTKQLGALLGALCD